MSQRIFKASNFVEILATQGRLLAVLSYAACESVAEVVVGNSVCACCYYEGKVKLDER